MVLPAADEPVRYEKHIRPLFRARDRQSMRFPFDLWSYDDVPPTPSSTWSALARCPQEEPQWVLECVCQALGR